MHDYFEQILKYLTTFFSLSTVACSYLCTLYAAPVGSKASPIPSQYVGDEQSIEPTQFNHWKQYTIPISSSTTF